MTVYRCGGVSPRLILEAVKRALHDFPAGVVVDGHLPSTSGRSQPIVFMFFLGFEILAYFAKPGLMTGPTGVVMRLADLDRLKEAYLNNYTDHLENNCQVYTAQSVLKGGD